MSYTHFMAWSTTVDTDGNIRVRIEGYLDAEDGAESVASIVDLLGDRPRDLVFEVAQMTGYRRGARVAWQNAMLQHRGQIRRFVVVGGSSVVRMGFSVVAMSLGVPLVVHDGERLAEADAPVRRKRGRSRSRSITRPMSQPLLGPQVPVRRVREESRSNQ